MDCANKKEFEFPQVFSQYFELCIALYCVLGLKECLYT